MKYWQENCLVKHRKTIGEINIGDLVKTQYKMTHVAIATLLLIGDFIQKSPIAKV